MHGRHVKVKREQASIFITAIFRRLGCDLCPSELFIQFDLFRARCGCRHRRLLSREILVLAKRIVCGAPSSVMVKSFAPNPEMNFPCLSFTTTVSTTNCALAVSV